MYTHISIQIDLNRTLNSSTSVSHVVLIEDDLNMMLYPYHTHHNIVRFFIMHYNPNGMSYHYLQLPSQ